MINHFLIPSLLPSVVDSGTLALVVFFVSELLDEVSFVGFTGFFVGLVIGLFVVFLVGGLFVVVLIGLFVVVSIGLFVVSLFGVLDCVPLVVLQYMCVRKACIDLKFGISFVLMYIGCS